ncbi:MAG: tRNA 5-hydroxyuridine modification protein YegQ [Gammaproteobacteria bacterium]|nr:tRNA 5-hydroxyuridine modification protein YegQ [Gammaproteobacteria bacterium]
MNKKIELLSPAGTLHNLHYAFAYGADAVYAGQPRYSLRVRNNDFTLDNLDKGIKTAHQLGKKLFVASNLLPHNKKVDTYMGDIEPVIEMKPDALIMADPGLIMMVRERWPDMPVHLSVQANTLNYASVNFWKSMGVSRIILSRELSLDEIEDIRQRCPDMELEVFVHGALCIAYSGRCLLSGYFNHRDPNQGSCTNACRWEYHMSPAEEDATGDIHIKQQDPEPALSQCGELERHPMADQVYLLEEGQRRGDMMPIMEDELGTYIMNSKDLRAIEHINRLVDIGIDSLKIEGRTKSHYYVARTAQLYRQAINDAQAGKPFNEQLLGALEGLANRGYTDGFYQRHHTQDHQNYMENVSRHNVQQFVGEITSYDAKSKSAEVLVKNKFSVGDRLELITTSGNHTFTVDKMEDLYHQPMESALGSGYQVRISVPEVPGELGMLARYV